MTKDENRGRLPNGHRAVVDISKLHDYCLNPEHPKGKDKARVFQAALALNQGDSEVLRLKLLTAARDLAALTQGTDEYGQRFRIDFEMEHQGRRAWVRSAWIVRRGDEFASLTTCHVR